MASNLKSREGRNVTITFFATVEQREVRQALGMLDRLAAQCGYSRALFIREAVVAGHKAVLASRANLAA